jgi:hypothetical protein
MYKTLTTTILLLFLVNTVLAQPASILKDIVLINVGNGCSPSHLTGFHIRVKGKVGKDKVGIVTALHGVVGCKTIRVSKRYKNLKIVQVDIERDVAFLYSSELENYSPKLQTENSAEYNGLYVVGHPLGIAQLRSDDLQIRQPPRQRLKNLIPRGKHFKYLKHRDSPSLKIEVLSIEGNFLRGHSGAPVFNAENKIVGVVNGGLGHGYSGIVWAIPWADIRWQSKSQINNKLSMLKTMPQVSVLASYSSEEILTLKIILKESTWAHRAQKHVIYQDIFTEHAASYHLSSPWGINLDKVKRVLIKKKNQVVFAEGSPNKELLSTDGNYGFMLSKNGGFLVLAVNPNPSVPKISVIKNKRLIWLDGDIRELTWNDAKRYVFQANQKGLGGYSDWQLPTTAQLKKLARFVRGKSNSFVSDYDGWFWSRNEKPSPHYNPLYRFAYVAKISSDERFQKGPEKIENSHYVILVRRVGRNY